LFLAAISAFASRRREQMFLWPLLAAWIRAVSPPYNKDRKTGSIKQNTMRMVMIRVGLEC
jgi:hypothetical protein